MESAHTRTEGNGRPVSGLGLADHPPSRRLLGGAAVAIRATLEGLTVAGAAAAFAPDTFRRGTAFPFHPLRLSRRAPATAILPSTGRCREAPQRALGISPSEYLDRAICRCFGNVFVVHGIRRRQVSDRPRHLQQAMVRARGKVESRCRVSVQHRPEDRAAPWAVDPRSAAHGLMRRGAGTRPSPGRTGNRPGPRPSGR